MPYMHTATLLSAHTEGAAHATFRAACAVTDPQWTHCGDDPIAWVAPADAAGGLCLWDRYGDLIRVEPRREPEAEEDAAQSAFRDLLHAGAVRGVVRASYASSGGRMVALCSSYGEWWITVGRMERAPRAGATEEAIQRADPGCTVYTLSAANAGTVPAEGERS